MTNSTAMEAAESVIALAFMRAPAAMAVVRVDAVDAPRIVEANELFGARFGRSARDLAGVLLTDLVRFESDSAIGALRGSQGAPMAVSARTDVSPLELRLTLIGPAAPELAVVSLTKRVVNGPDPAVHWLRSIVDNSAALVFVKDFAGHYLFVNRHFERRFGLAHGDAVGRTDFELFPHDAAAAYTANDERVLASGEAMEVEEPEVDGGRWLSIKFPLTDDRGVVYALGGISTDISDRKRAEAAAREARDEAQRANRAKSEFLSRMSHELRTPLNAILGFGQLLSLEPLPDTAQPSVARILRAGQYLLALINEVLDLARIEAGALRFAVEPVHAPAPLAEALELTRPLARDRGIALSADMHGGMHRYCAADRQRLVQVLLNLLANAVKYNRPGGIVRVSIRERDASLRYLVTDTGPGLDADAQTRAFKPFERLTAEGSDIEGTGLGLALSRSLVEGMGGRLGIQHSVPGEGSTFYVELPLSAARPDEVGEPGAIAAGVDWEFPPATVLYVEDNLSNVELVRGILSHMPAIELIPAMQGGMAVDLAVQHRPDVILLDLNLPDLDGDEVLRRLRADVRTSAIPVVVLSADATPATIARLGAHGIAGYVTKPLDIVEFVGVLRTAVAA